MTQMFKSKNHGQEYIDFGSRLAHLREERGFTQEKFCELLNIPQSTYAAYEKGTRKLPISLLKKVSVFLGVTSDYLLEVFSPKKEETNTIFNKVNTIAAHHDGSKLNKEELEYIELTIEMLLKKRGLKK